MTALPTTYNGVFTHYLRVGFSVHQACVMTDAWLRRQS